jgi:putative transposase
MMGRGIDGVKIFRNRKDREDLLDRLADLCRADVLRVYVWALMSNHLLLRTGNQPLSISMRKPLTGYVVNYNRRHKRYCHLFISEGVGSTLRGVVPYGTESSRRQNRYKSILCEDDPYLVDLTRYIHLNPLRAGIVKSLKELKGYQWCGHSGIMWRVKRQWQDRDAVLAYFGKSKKRAIERYEDFVQQGIEAGSQPELVGGGFLFAVVGDGHRCFRYGGWGARFSQMNI